MADGFTMEQALAAAEAFEEAAQPKRTARQERNARYYQSKKASEKRLKASYSDETVLNKTPSRGLAHVEDNLPREEISGRGKEEKKPARDDLAAFKAELSDLDADRLDAIVKHRRARKAQNTAHAAKLFRRDAKEAGLSMADAVDTCISRNWLTVKAEWLRPKGQQTAPPQQRTMNDVLNEIIEGKPNGFTGPTVDASYERADRGSATGIVQLHAIAARNRPG